MAGHSHWAQIKHKKAKIDAQRGKLFTRLIREITVAVRDGGPNPDNNPRLRSAIESARKVNMPMETIERAIKKGSGELAGENYEEVIYEGYAPGGVALMIITLTDNRNRTTSEVRHALTKHGGNLGSAGCVSYLFESVGLIEVSKSSIDEEKLYELSIEAGALDFESTENSFFVYTSPKDLYSVKDVLEKSVPIEKAELTFKPTTLVQVSDEDTARKVLKLIDMLDELDDVRQVIANFDIPQEILSKLAD